MRPLRGGVMLVVCALLSGCRSLGPPAVVRDRLDYSAAVARSWQEQTLLNVVKSRYNDAPLLVDVNQILGAYELRRDVSLSGFWYPGTSGDYASVGAVASLADRPTITYAPVTGEKYAQMKLAPVSTVQLFHLLQAGWPADFLLSLLLSSLDGARNESGDRPPDPEFTSLVEGLREAQKSGSLDFRVREEEGRKVATILLRPRAVADAAAVDALRQRFGVSAGPIEVVLLSSGLRGQEGQLTALGRSLFQAIFVLGQQVDVPADHLSGGFARPSRPRTEGLPAFKVHSGPSRPERAFVSV